MGRWHTMYGAVSRRIQGTCSLIVEDARFEGPFELIQLGDGAIYMRLLTTASIAEALGSVNIPMLPQAHITGWTTNGLTFSATPYGATNVSGTLALKSDLELRLGIRDVTVGEAHPQPTRSRYGLVNVRFTPNRTVMRKRSIHPLMVVDVPDEGSVILRPVRRYKEIEQMLRAQQNSAVSCAASTSVSAAAMEQLCHMISLAQGTIVNWVWREDYVGRLRVGIRLENRITRPYTNLHLLPTQEPHVIPNFLSNTWSRFEEVFEQYRLSAVIGLMAEARRGRNSDLEARGILLSVVLELLAGTYGREEGVEFRMSNTEFKAGRRIWKAEIKSALNKAYAGRSDIDRMMTFIERGLNRRPFGERLQAMTEALGVPPDPIPLDKQIARTVNIRNKLVHEGRFPSTERDSMADEFFWLMTFVDRLVLKLVGYSGKYRTFQDNSFVTQVLP